MTPLREIEEYPVPGGPAEAEIREKGSRFLALLRPASDESEAKQILARLASEHPDATHHCWAWRIGWPPRERCHDAGEPSGTAGPPVLGALQAAGVSDALLVVVRWYGGTNLGKGGLVRAYGGAARAALGAGGIGRRLLRHEVEVRLPYEELGALRRLVNPPELEIVGERYGADVTLRLAAVPSRLAALEELVASRGLRLDPLARLEEREAER